MLVTKNQVFYKKARCGNVSNFDKVKMFGRNLLKKKSLLLNKLFF